MYNLFIYFCKIETHKSKMKALFNIIFSLIIVAKVNYRGNTKWYILYKYYEAFVS